MNYQGFKHVVDVAGSVVLTACLSPVLLLTALAIRLDSRGPAVYRQRRIGRGGREFTIYKFRSMKIDAPVLSTEEMQQQKIIPFTRLGPILRKTNLDELPQLFNVMKGEMSFIGPRPALPTQTDVNELREARGVHALRPGITGLAQANGRDELDTETKVGYDAQYLATMSPGTDLKILLKTIGTVLSARGNK